MNMVVIRRKIRSIQRRVREARMFAIAMRSPHHPVLAHIIPTRRCNLSCSYCNEYDNHAEPVPTAEMLCRVDMLASLGTTIITISGGEPLLHPGLEEIIRHIRSHGIIATLLTNGYLLTPERIDRLNHAGLDRLQIGIDNLVPDQVSKKSLKLLEGKLRCLARTAEFDIEINSVIGAPVRNPEGALFIARQAASLGFNTIVGIIHDHSGQHRQLTEQHRRILAGILSLRRSTFSFTRWNHFQDNLARGLPNDWRCRAGSRYLYVCEDGLVHWCSQQRGHPGIPLAAYTQAHLEREYHSIKPCAPYCTIGCVHRVAMLDELRENPSAALGRWLNPGQRQGGPPNFPVPVRVLSWMFLGEKSSVRRQVFTSATLRLLGIR